MFNALQSYFVGDRAVAITWCLNQLGVAFYIFELQPQIEARGGSGFDQGEYIFSH